MLQKATIKHVSKYIDQSSQVLLRADFNVPIKENQITDPTRIQGIMLIYLSHSSHNQNSSFKEPQIPGHPFSSWSTRWQEEPEIHNETCR